MLVQVGGRPPTWRKGTIERGGRPQSGSSPVPCDDEVVKQLACAHVVLDRVAERLGAVRAEREPELERPERARVLERDVDDMCSFERSCGMYDSSCENALRRGPRGADEEDAAGFREEEPLVGVERDRVGAVEAGEEVGRRGRGRRGQPVGAVDVEPDALFGAHVGEPSIGSTAPVSVVPAVATTATGTPGRAVGADRLGDRHPAAGAGRRRSASERTLSEPSPRISAARSIE